MHKEFIKESRQVPKKFTEVNYKTKDITVKINPIVYEGEIERQEIFIAQVRV